VLARSPLLAPVASHVLLHFQLHRDGRLTSPQVPTGHQRKLAEASFLSSEQLERAAQRLAAFQRILAAPADSASRTDRVSSTSQTAAPALPSVDGFDNAGMLMRETERPVDVVLDRPLAPSETSTGQAERGPVRFDETVQVTQMTEQQQFRNAAEFNYRVNNFIQAQQRVSLQNVLQQYESPLSSAPTRGAATQGVFRAVWLDDALVLARRVNFGSDFMIQGCWLDWVNLRPALLDSIRDLFPEAELEPVARPPDGPNARLLASLPVQLLTGSATPLVTAVWTPLRVALLAAWIGVLIAGLAVALLLRGTLSLSERRAAFVSAVTHELRTPLTTFKLYSEMLAEGIVTDESKRQGYLATLCTEADRLTHLVENVLAYARLERGDTRQREEQLALGELLERVRPRLLQRVEQAGLTLVEDADAQARHTVVRLNVAAVEQILFNLVDNACKYAAPTATTRTLHLETRPSHGRFVILRVRDHGPGLTTEAIRHLFQPFSKSSQSAAETVPGVGLGLALSRQLSRGLGGDLRLDRQVKDGAAFILSLPRISA
jgi:signal transduction histidine kinase